jgi:hypothetical protein
MNSPAQGEFIGPGARRGEALKKQPTSFPSAQPNIAGDTIPITTTNHPMQSTNYHVPSVVYGSQISIRRWLQG